MIPKGIDNKTITVYNYFKYPNGTETYKRTVIKDAYYTTNISEQFKSTGNETKTNIMLYVNYYNDYVSYKDWKDLTKPNGKFTFDNSISGRETLIVFEECNYEFGLLTESEMSDKITEFLDTYTDYARVRQVSEVLYGSLDMWHIEILC